MKQNIDSYIINILDAVNSSIYWKDKDGYYLGCNTFAAKMVKLNDPNEIIGKTDYDLFSKIEADVYRKHDLQVIKGAKSVVLEEEVLREDGKKFWHLSSKQPLYDGKTMIGIVGSSIDITAQKESELLRAEIEKRKAVDNQQKAFQEFFEKLIENITPLVQTIDNFKFSTLNNKLGIFHPDTQTENIDLTKREQEVLYYLALNQSPKEIASTLTSIEHKEHKPVKAKTIQSIIDTKLYPKFGVYNVSNLVEKAKLLNLIPFIL